MMTVFCKTYPRETLTSVLASILVLVQDSPCKSLNLIPSK